VTVAVWRIAAETPTYSASDMTGTGVKNSGGRWNSPGTPIIYCCTDIALATLETLSFIRAGSLPYNRFLIRIDIPDHIWRNREVLALPGGWDAVPSGMASRKAGDEWIRSARSSLSEVPSVIVPEEKNILINPSHPDVSKMVATILKKWIYDPRFF
jgi:RES domain-containing protein